MLGGLWVVAQLEGVSFQVLLEQLRNGRATIAQQFPLALWRMTFRRLLGFLRPYRGQVIAVRRARDRGRRPAALAIPYLTGRVIDAAQRGDSRRRSTTLAAADRGRRARSRA